MFDPRCALRDRLDSAILRQATYGTARIGLHTAFSERLKEMNGGQNIPFMQKFVSSFVSGAIASSIGNPFDVCVRSHARRSAPAASAPAARLPACLLTGGAAPLSAAGAHAGRQHEAGGRALRLQGCR